MSLSVVARWSCLLLVVVACREIPTAPVVIDAHLSSTELWSGGELRITAASFAPPAALPTVLLGTDSLTVRRVDDSTVAARLPRSTGAFELRIVQGRSTAIPATVRLYGYLDEYETPAFSGTPHQLVSGGPPLLIGEGNSGAAILNLTTNTVSMIAPDSVHSPDCATSAGPTYLPDTWVFTGKYPSGGCQAARVWGLRPSLHIVDSVGGLFTFEAWYTMAQPGPHRWVFDWNNFLYFEDCSGGSPCVRYNLRDPNGPWETLISPRLDRFVMLPSNAGTVVYSSVTMDTAYVDSRGSWAGAYSAEGDTLYLAQDTAFVATRASDGVALRTFSYGTLAQSAEVNPVAVAQDPNNPLLYVALASRSWGQGLWRFEIVVLDRSTWDVLGILVQPVAAEGRPFNPCILVPSPVEHRLYLVESFNGYNLHGYPASVWRFQTPP